MNTDPIASRDGESNGNQPFRPVIPVANSQPQKVFLPHSQERYEILVRSIAGIFWEADVTTFQFTFVSERAEQLLGYPLHQWLEADFWINHIYPPDRDQTINACLMAIQQRQNHELEYRMVTADGRLIWLKDLVTVVEEAGQPILLRGVMMDMTCEKQREEALQAQQVQLDLALEVAQITTWTLDLKTQVITCSNHADTLSRLPASVLGYSTCQEFLEHVYPEDRELLHQAMARSLQNHNDYEVEFRIFWPDGSLHWVNSRGRVLCDSEGQPMQMVGVTMDITQRRQSEQQQLEREALIAVIVQNIRQSLDFKHILNTTVAEVRRFLQTDRVFIFRFRTDGNSGVVTAESVAQGWRSIAGETFQDPCFARNFAQLYEQGRIRSLSNLQTENLPECYLKMLQALQVQAMLIVPIHEKGGLWGLLIAHHCQEPRSWQPFEIDLLKQLAVQVGIAIEQSELYQQVQRLNANLERQVHIRTAELQLASEFEATLKRITDRVRDSLDEDQILQTAVQELAMALGVTSCNAALYDLEQRTSKVSYEYTDSRVALQGRVVQMDNFPEGYQQLLQGQYFQFCSLTPNPLRGYVAMLACPILDNELVMGDLWLVSHKYRAFNQQDIGLVQQVANQCAIAIRQARLYQRAQAQVEVLAELNRLKDDFLSTVSHELRTPMSNIKLATQMLETILFRNAGQPPSQGGLNSEDAALILPAAAFSKAVKYFQILKDECQREISLINDLLDLSRLETGSDVPVLQAIDLASWLRQRIEPFLERARSQQQILQISIPSNLPVFATDPSHLDRIVTELLNNACKYTPAGETIAVTVQIIEGADVRSQVLQIHVCNSGVEISREELNRIFDKFYRIPNNDPWKHGGTGLGLALVKKLVESLGGTIQVSSADRQTRFVVELPSLTVECD
ncbi:MAG: PAS domain-containing protein [Leptodesmis sp.]